MDTDLIPEYKRKYPAIYASINETFIDFTLNDNQFTAEYIQEEDYERNEIKIYYNGVPFMVFIHDCYDMAPSSERGRWVVTNYYVLVLQTISHDICMSDIPELAKIAMFIFQVRFYSYERRNKINLIINDRLEFTPDCVLDVNIYVDEMMDYISEYITYKDVAPE